MADAKTSIDTGECKNNAWERNKCMSHLLYSDNRNSALDKNNVIVNQPRTRMPTGPHCSSRETDKGNDGHVAKLDDSSCDRIIVNNIDSYNNPNSTSSSTNPESGNSKVILNEELKQDEKKVRETDKSECDDLLMECYCDCFLYLCSLFRECCEQFCDHVCKCCGDGCCECCGDGTVYDCFECCSDGIGEHCCDGCCDSWGDCNVDCGDCDNCCDNCCDDD